MLIDLLVILFCLLGWAAMRARRVPPSRRTLLDALGIEPRDERAHIVRPTDNGRPN